MANYKDLLKKYINYISMQHSKHSIPDIGLYLNDEELQTLDDLYKELTQEEGFIDPSERKEKFVVPDNITEEERTFLLMSRPMRRIWNYKHIRRLEVDHKKTIEEEQRYINSQVKYRLSKI